jgi:hypothetical protein
VARKIIFALFRFFPEFGDDAAVADHPFGGKAVMDIHAQFVFGQIPDMPPGGENEEVFPQISGDRARFRGGFHNHDIFRHGGDHYAERQRDTQPHLV